MAKATLLLAAMAVGSLFVPTTTADHIPPTEGSMFHDNPFTSNGNCLWHQTTVVFTPFCAEDEVLAFADAVDVYVPLAYDYFALGFNTGYGYVVLGYCTADQEGFFPDWYEIPPCSDVPAGPILP